MKTQWIDLKLIGTRICQECDGTGVVWRGACGVCGARHEFDYAPSLQPCGHSWHDYIEEATCLECGGSGRVEVEFDFGKFVELLDDFVANVRIFAINKRESESDIDSAAQELLAFLRASTSEVTNATME